jgi:hypothetical protein
VDVYLADMEVRVTDDMNAQLLREFSVEEVGGVLSQMHLLKSPRPDGFTAYFYKKSWGTVGSEVCKDVLIFLNGEFLMLLKLDIHRPYSESSIPSSLD